jgi:hypothetical protein
MSIEERNKLLTSAVSPIAGLCKPVPSFCTFIANLQRHLRWERSQTNQPQQVLGCTHEMRVQLHADNATKARSTQSAPAHPAEDLLDPLALSLAHPVALMPRRASVQARGVALRRSICQRFPPGRERRAWLTWTARLNEAAAVCCLRAPRRGAVTPGDVRKSQPERVA